MIYARHTEYDITSWDDNKILFFQKGVKEITTGIIDLKLKTLTYTTPYTNSENKLEYREVKIETDYQKIQELEKKIIKNRFKKRIF